MAPPGAPIVKGKPGAPSRPRCNDRRNRPFSLDHAGAEEGTMMRSDRPLLAGRKAVVTASSAGLGAGVAQALAAAGAAVAINHPGAASAAAAEAVATAIRDSGGTAIVLRADVAREDEVEAMVARLLDTFGRLDILVANAGIQRDAAIEAMTLAQ